MNADAILTLARSFWECRILLTAAELDLFALLAAAPLSAQAVTQRLSGSQRAVTILLDALAAMGLLTKTNGRYGCEPDIAALLTGESPQSVLPMVLHSAALWPSWSNLTDFVRGRAVVADAPPTEDDAARQRAFIGAMDVVSRPRAGALIQAMNLGTARRMIDVGGGPGTYTAAALRAFPPLRATLFDLPTVVELARPRLAAAGVLDRVTLVGGDFYTDELPGDHDFALLSAIIHQNSRAQNVDLYRKVARALVRGGRLVIRDHVMSPDRTEPRDGAIFAVNMLVRTAGGNVYTFDEIREDLLQAGFVAIRLLQSGAGMIGLVEARCPTP